MKLKTMVIISTINLVFCLVLFALFFPTIEIFGFEHQIASPGDALLHITISPETLFGVLSSNFYSLGIKYANFSFFILQIISLILGVLSIILIILKKEKMILITMLCSVIATLITSILSLALFYNKMSLNIFSSILFVLSLANCVFYFFVVFLKKQKIKNT
ncbi:MAG: hypothetical protein RR734_00905 [Bacilli bacterium]